MNATAAGIVRFDGRDAATKTTHLLRTLPAGTAEEHDGGRITITREGLTLLATLDDEHDGHYDGQHIWMGGTEYRVSDPDDVAEIKAFFEQIRESMTILDNTVERAFVTGAFGDAEIAEYTGRTRSGVWRQRQDYQLNNPA